MVRETFESGRSVAAVARDHGLNANMVFCWRRDGRFRAADQPLANTIEFLPVHIRAGDDGATVPAKAEADEKRRIEIVLNSGHRLSIEGDFDGAAVAALLQTLTS